MDPFTPFQPLDVGTFQVARKVLCYHSLTGNRTIYDYEISDVHGKHAVDWSRYRGNVVLLVNVASF